MDRHLWRRRELRTAAHPGRPGGFTLVELTVVLVILGVMTAAAVPALGVWLDREPTPAEAVAGLLRQGRSAALEFARSVTITLDPGTGRWVMETEGMPARDGVLGLGEAEIAGADLSDAIAATSTGGVAARIVVRFAPTGGAAGGPLWVRADGRVQVVRADRWTGEVSLHGS